MARVVVTGSSGKLGQAVVEHLADHGYDLVTVDQVPGLSGQDPADHLSAIAPAAQVSGAPRRSSPGGVG